VTISGFLAYVTVGAALWVILSMYVGSTLRLVVFCIVAAVVNALIYRLRRAGKR
jgi:hypothetical protein